MALDPSTVNTIVAAAATTLIPLVGGLGAVGIALLRKRYNLQVSQAELQREDNLRAGMQASLVTAVGMYVRGNKDEATAYMKTQAAEAIEHFGITPQALDGLILNKAAALAGVTTTPAPAIITTNA